MVGGLCLIKLMIGTFISNEGEDLNNQYQSVTQSMKLINFDDWDVYHERERRPGAYFLYSFDKVRGLGGGPGLNT